MRRTRVLVVDDFALFRTFISNLLSEDSQFHIVGEAEDGLSAVRMAAALQPDIVTLDVNMPTLNGFAAARMIHQVSPSSQILFLTSEVSKELVHEAFSCGASGYLVKHDMSAQLLPMLRALDESRVNSY